MNAFVRGDQRDSSHQCGGSDDTIGRVFWIASRKPHGLNSHPASDRQDNKPRLNLCKECFQAGVQPDTALALNRGDLKQRYIGYRKPLPGMTGLLNNYSSFL